uniref:Uncharacterized protein n=1 Tax=Arcella intermedia TaxID=1963864 RepID=A0A6B2L5K2_9EUKA
MDINDTLCGLLKERGITSVIIKGRQMTDEMVLAMNKLLNGSKICLLELFEAQLQGNKIDVLLHNLHTNITLKILRLPYNDLGIEGIKHLCGSLSINKTLQELSLEGNEIEEESLSLLCSCGPDLCLTSLSLANCNLQPPGGTHIANLLKSNTTLKSLGLPGNELKLEGITPISQALRNNTLLTSLDLSNNLLGVPGINTLCNSLLHNTTLQTLDVASNQIGEGIIEIAQLLVFNKTIQSIGLRDNRPPRKRLTPTLWKFFQLIGNRPTFTTVNIRKNILPGDGEYPSMILTVLKNNYMFHIHQDFVFDRLCSEGFKLFNKMNQVKRASFDWLAHWSTLDSSFQETILFLTLISNKPSSSLSLLTKDTLSHFFSYLIFAMAPRQFNWDNSKIQSLIATYCHYNPQ